MPQEELGTADSPCSGAGLAVKKLRYGTGSPAGKTEITHRGRTAKSTFNKFSI